MANGSFNGTSSNSSVNVRVVWSSTGNTSGNSSLVTASLQLYKNCAYSYRTYGTGTWSITINGTRTALSRAVSLYSGTGWVTAVSASVTVPHNADGTKSISISASGGISGTSLSSVSASRTVALDNIPRKSTLTLASAAAAAGETVHLSVTRADASFTHRMVFSIGNRSDTLELGSALSADYTLPLSFCTALPTQVQGTVTCTLETYANGTRIGTHAVPLTMTVPAGIVPTLTTVSAEVIDGIGGLFIQNRSRARLIFTGAAGAYGSSITACIAAGLATSTAAQIVTPVLAAAGSCTFSCRAVDSRGRESAAVPVTIRVEAYEPPRLTCSAQRVRTDGTPDTDGTSLLLRAEFSCSSLSGQNSASCTISYREHGADSWTSAGTAVSGTPRILSGGFDPAKTWEVRFLCTDTADGRTEYTVIVPQSFRLMNVNGILEGIAFGKLAARRGVDIALPAFFCDAVTVDGAPLADFIAAEGGSDPWRYIRLKNGTVILFYRASQTQVTVDASHSGRIAAELPFSVEDAVVLPWADGAQNVCWGGAGRISGEELSFRVLSFDSGTLTVDCGAVIIGQCSQS